MEKNPLDWDNFLPEITHEILSHIPADYALQCKQVSKSWQTFFGHMQEGMIFAIGLYRKEKTNFRLYYATHDVIEQYSRIKKEPKYHNIVKMVHLPPIGYRYHKNPYGKYKDVIVGSCNGLICITLPNGVIGDPVYICNPCTRESVNLPKLTSIGSNSVVVSGFGYYITSEHKVVIVYYPDQNVSVGHVEVYTLGSGNGWRNKGEIKYSLCRSPGVLVEGILYWIDYKATKIVGFNLENEKFTLVPSPPCLCLDKSASNNNLLSVEQSYRLKILKGCLCVVHCVRANKRILFKGSDRIDIWFFMKDDGHGKNLESNKYCHRSWRREFSIANRKIGDELDPFFITEKNKVLLWHYKSNLVCFDCYGIFLRYLPFQIYLLYICHISIVFVHYLSCKPSYFLLYFWFLYIRPDTCNSSVHLFI
ncbi:F-box/kelch-repeat protein At3g16580-like [Papaver somniferum]|uniref:F-box/kelch-repeat protein At3g16580-like n=1 Tax=Papaver somniferum TaxID=3469 RepID=UPI000E705B8E|nr:F-box/kelch-repeat protein At3g16580-like [Papaver somniferum]